MLTHSDSTHTTIHCVICNSFCCYLILSHSNDYFDDKLDVFPFIVCVQFTGHLYLVFHWKNRHVLLSDLYCSAEYYICCKTKTTIKLKYSLASHTVETQLLYPIYPHHWGSYFSKHLTEFTEICLLYQTIPCFEFLLNKELYFLDSLSQELLNVSIPTAGQLTTKKYAIFYFKVQQ